MSHLVDPNSTQQARVHWSPSTSSTPNAPPYKPRLSATKESSVDVEDHVKPASSLQRRSSKGSNTSSTRSFRSNTGSAGRPSPKKLPIPHVVIWTAKHGSRTSATASLSTSGSSRSSLAAAFVFPELMGSNIVPGMDLSHLSPTITEQPRKSDWSLGSDTEEDVTPRKRNCCCCC
ncbi:hypothetical protein EGW08_014092 [Elysia chlorotica]|uniref:Uncharacterized protein n=1 Tax=Elysia chlorotica TaxID=188477 RepID=A0A3S1BDE4_ELYCH|nr:hypothetical protein EGW08_014092 [Elysia chlorotica]